MLSLTKPLCMEDFLPFIGIPLVFIVFFVLFRYVIPALSDWRKLAERYSTTLNSTTVEGERIHFGDIKIGSLNMRNMVKGYKTEEGLFLTQYLFFQGKHPNLLIPWEAFHRPEQRNILFIKRVRLSVGFPSIISHLEMPEKNYLRLADRLPKKLN